MKSTPAASAASATSTNRCPTSVGRGYGSPSTACHPTPRLIRRHRQVTLQGGYAVDHARQNRRLPCLGQRAVEIENV